MYNSQEIANRIKLMIKSNGISQKTMLTECGLGINTISQMSKGNDMLSKNLARIADYLNCSVDYLLGRTDEPSTVSNVIGGNVTGGAVVQGYHNSNVTVNSSERKLTDEEIELLRLFNSLDVKRRIKLLDYGFALEDESVSKKTSAAK